MLVFRKTKKALFELWMTHPEQENRTVAFQQLTGLPSTTVLAHSFGQIKSRLMKQGATDNLGELPSTLKLFQTSRYAKFVSEWVGLV